ncbi:hypothetical protein CFC21_022236 [Triticum aestivum]|uniref:Gnk2-homologous domain-containing protein n=2 Tax=Triticum aestivum TaxID=4565 RepID=A0A9R1EC61_WHEAT|nr:hypothetical protein CFC21_022236 [Triticum aestivum]
MASSGPPFLLLLLVVVLVAVAAASEERPRVIPTLLQCHPAQAQATANASSAKNATAFQANAMSLLAKLPSAAAPTGFASLRSAGVVGRDVAFVRGLCFGYATPSQCRECLAAAAKKLADACGARGRRAGVWMDACFASYADANPSSPNYDGFRARVISGADALITSTSYELQSLADLAWRMGPVAATNAGMQVAVDWTAAASDYSKNSTSARAGDTCCWGLDAWHDGVAGAVVGFDCYLRFDVAVATATAPARVPLLKRLGKFMNDHPCLTAVFGMVGAGLAVAPFYVLIEGICRWMESKIRPINNAPVVPVADVAASELLVSLQWQGDGLMV